MTNDNDIMQCKFEMLMQAYEQANHQDEAMSELRDAAFEVLLLHPGCGLNEFGELLAEQYGNELIDAFGDDIDEITKSVIELWQSSYRDETSGLERSFEKWAEAFATEAAVQMYYDLIKQKVT